MDCDSDSQSKMSKPTKKTKRKHQRGFDEEEIIGKNKSSLAPAAKTQKIQIPADVNSDSDTEIEDTKQTYGKSTEIKYKADRLQEALSVLLISAGKTPNHTDLKQIAVNATKMHALLLDSLMQCSKLEGQVQALELELDKQRKVNKELPQQIPAPRDTYVSRLGVKSNIAARCTQKRDPPNVVAIIPNDTNIAKNSDETKSAVQKIVSPSEQQLNISNIKKIQESGILIETPNKRDIAALMTNRKLKEAGFSVQIPAKKNPRIIIYNVTKQKPDQEIMDDIAKQNNFNSQEKQILKEQTKLAFKTGDKTRNTCNWVLETSKAARDILIKRDRLYIEWTCCGLKDYIAATRCYKCQSFGHTTKFCNSTTDTCGHCGASGHAFKSCPNKSKSAVCINCKRNGKPHNHNIRDKECPAYGMAINQVVSRIDYGL